MEEFSFLPLRLRDGVNLREFDSLGGKLSPVTKINDEVFVTTAEIVRFDSRCVDLIKGYASQNRRGRARICAHRAVSDNIHEMLIAMRCDSYIHPHRHWGKVESFHLVEGSADIVVFSEDGSISEVVELRDGGNFFYRLNSVSYHTVLIESPMLVVHETTNGPFDPQDSDFAAFAPAAGEDAVETYIFELKQRVKLWKEETSMRPVHSLIF